MNRAKGRSIGNVPIAPAASPLVARNLLAYRSSGCRAMDRSNVRREPEESGYHGVVVGKAKPGKPPQPSQWSVTPSNDVRYWG